MTIPAANEGSSPRIPLGWVFGFLCIGLVAWNFQIRGELDQMKQACGQMKQAHAALTQKQLEMELDMSQTLKQESSKERAKQLGMSELRSLLSSSSLESSTKPGSQPTLDKEGLATMQATHGKLEQEVRRLAGEVEQMASLSQPPATDGKLEQEVRRLAGEVERMSQPAAAESMPTELDFDPRRLSSKAVGSALSGIDIVTDNTMIRMGESLRSVSLIHQDFLKCAAAGLGFLPPGHSLYNTSADLADLTSAACAPAEREHIYYFELPFAAARFCVRDGIVLAHPNSITSTQQSSLSSRKAGATAASELVPISTAGVTKWAIVNIDIAEIAELCIGRHRAQVGVNARSIALHVRVGICDGETKKTRSAMWRPRRVNENEESLTRV